jgi:hypothetical protein
MPRSCIVNGLATPLGLLSACWANAWRRAWPQAARERCRVHGEVVLCLLLPAIVAAKVKRTPYTAWGEPSTCPANARRRAWPCAMRTAKDRAKGMRSEPPSRGESMAKGLPGGYPEIDHPSKSRGYMSTGVFHRRGLGPFHGSRLRRMQGTIPAQTAVNPLRGRSHWNVLVREHGETT